MSSCTQTRAHTHTRVHAHTQTHTQLQIDEGKDQKKTGPSIEPCGTPGPLGAAAALFHVWGDWPEIDNETNYVINRACCKIGVRSVCAWVCSIFLTES